MSQTGESQTDYAEFTWELQRQFARVSGDHNPIHTDEAAAGVVLYGMHLTLWALDRLALRGLVGSAISGLRVRFTSPVAVGERIEMAVLRATVAALSVELRARDVVVAAISFKRGEVNASAGESLLGEGRISATDPDPRQPVDLPLEQFTGKAGRVGFLAGAAAMFPAAAARVGETRVQALASISRLVGMVCPGLHSMSYQYKVDFSSGGESDRFLEYSVEEVDERFRLVTQLVRGGGIFGIVVAISPDIAVNG